VPQVVVHDLKRSRVDHHHDGLSLRVDRDLARGSALAVGQARQFIVFALKRVRSSASIRP